ncbi:hypothetical protein T484DRAFT_1955411 [Baffinella frigidus]|nr:hypothetical protein T484DRAFT_1955411 [Cryptophyta sp. CCMP2293]
MERFAVVNPQAAQNIQALKNAGTISALGGLGGVGAGAAFFMNRPGTVNGRLFSMALGGCAWGIMGFLVGTNAASLITGTYKINPMKTHAVFTDWWRANGGAVE